MIKHLFLFLPLFAGCLLPVFADSDAESILQERMRTPLLQVQGTLTGEGLCWHAAYNMDRFIRQYLATKDTAFLDAAVKYYDALIAKLHPSPDGYLGWVGPYIYDEKFICDVHVGDAILINPMLEFAEAVLKQSPTPIVQKYGEHARKYLELAKNQLIKKWDARGTWHEDGPYGAYVSWDQYLTPDQLNEWRALPVLKSSLTLPFNKQNTMALACLRIYRITGEAFYREKAVKIFNYMKSRMCLFQDHYVWNYWEPFGAWDIDFDTPNTLRHWVNVHPYRNYQAGEIDQIVEAYHSGITFTQEDLQRIINTNLQVMWNGDMERPGWRNSNYAVETASLGKPSITQAPGGEFPELAGTLWRGLSDFDSTIRRLAKRSENPPPSFQRKYKELPVSEFSVPFIPNCYLNLAVVLPSEITKAATVFLLSQNRVSGPVDVALYSCDGKNKIQSLRTGQKEDPEGLLIIPWKGNDLAPGAYCVRWTFKDQYREFPIQVK